MKEQIKSRMKDHLTDSVMEPLVHALSYGCWIISEELAERKANGHPYNARHQDRYDRIFGRLIDDAPDTVDAETIKVNALWEFVDMVVGPFVIRLKRLSGMDDIPDNALSKRHRVMVGDLFEPAEKTLELLSDDFPLFLIFTIDENTGLLNGARIRLLRYEMVWESEFDISLNHLIPDTDTIGSLEPDGIDSEEQERPTSDDKEETDKDEDGKSEDAG